MQTNERVVVVKGGATKWYSQAVFIINPNIPACDIPVDFVAEAERIIYNYMASKHGVNDGIHAYLHTPDTPPTAKSKKRFKFGLLLYVLMVAACIGMAAVITLGLLR